MTNFSIKAKEFERLQEDRHNRHECEADRREYWRKKFKEKAEMNELWKGTTERI
jgi:hypothetical protein